MTIKEVLDGLFKGVKFDTELYRRIVRNNVEYITRNEEHKELFGGRYIGCYYISYTMYDKDIFYENLFGFASEKVIEAIAKITTIPPQFKVARDDVNLVCFYVAHRFLSNESLSENKRKEYAAEILNYFNYRTLVLISSTYFVYPISKEKAVTLSEKLNNKYVIKRVKSWNEYCIYRSEEYLDSKFLSLLTQMDDDAALPNAIVDLLGRTKDTLKNIYREFLKMMEKDNIIKSRNGVVNDLEGKEVLMDKIGSGQKYIAKVTNSLSSRSDFVRKEYLSVVADMVKTISYENLEITLSNIADYHNSSAQASKQTDTVMSDILLDVIGYLNKSSIMLNDNTSVLSIMNSVYGSVMYARGEELSINKVKDDIAKLIKDSYKLKKGSIKDRTVNSLRGAVYLYVTMLAIL